MFSILEYIKDLIGYWIFYNPSVFWTVFALFIVAFRQLKISNNTNKATFINKFNEGFFDNKYAVDLLTLIDYDALDFQISDKGCGKDNYSRGFQYFVINKDVLKKLKISPEDKIRLAKKAIFTSYEIDSFFGYFEDMGSFERQGWLSIHDIYTSFDWYIENCWENKEIHKYILNERTKQPNGEDLYENFEYIYQKCVSYTRAKQEKEIMWLWNFKWWLFKNINIRTKRPWRI